MFKICEIPAKALFDTGCDFPVYGVSDPEAPEDHTIIFVKGTLAESAVQVRNSIFIAGEELKPALDASCILLKSSMPKNLYGELLERLVSLMPQPPAYVKDESYIS